MKRPKGQRNPKHINGSSMTQPEQVAARFNNAVGPTRPKRIKTSLGNVKK